MIGDHKQLPAIVLQDKSESKIEESALQESGLSNLSNSLFERLYLKYKEMDITRAYAVLSKQGRMHPDIAAFPSHHFYNGILDCAGLPHQIKEEENAPRLAFFDILPSPEDKSDKSNMAEALQVVAVCKELKDSDHSIGIITPFRKQIALIRKLLADNELNNIPSLVVDTVERFQGSQRDIIIYSFCIKTQGQLLALPNYTEDDGQLIDRKLNVALTRARKYLYIIGNKHLLNQNIIYRQLIEYIEQWGATLNKVEQR